MSELLNFILAHEEQFRGARLESLYSDFRPFKFTNSVGYAANTSAWRRALLNATRAGRIPAVSGGRSDLLVLRTGDELLSALESPEVGRPQALGTVLDDGVALGEMIPLEYFLALKERISAHRSQSWSISPWQLVTWGLRTLGLAGGAAGEDKLAVGRFVLTGNVMLCGKRVLQKIAGRDIVDRVFSEEHFHAEFSHILDSDNEGRLQLSHTDIDVLLRYLSRDTKDIAYDGKTIKFLSPSDHRSAPTITFEEATIASMKYLVYSHTGQIDALTTRINELSQTARAAIKNKNRSAAIAALRSRKIAESTLTRRSDMLAQIEDVLEQIRRAGDHVALVKAMEESTGVLRSLNKQTGGVERVENVVDSLREEMDKADEVGQAIQQLGPTTIDDGEVDDELAALENAANAEKEATEAVLIQGRLAALDRQAVATLASPATQPPSKCPDKVLEEDTVGDGQLSLDEDSPQEGPTEQAKPADTVPAS